MKKRVVELNSSIHRRSADCASLVKLSALRRTIVLNLTPAFDCIFALAKNFSSSRINFIPFPCEQFTIITLLLIFVLSPSYILHIKSSTSVFLPVPGEPWKIIFGIWELLWKKSSRSLISLCIFNRVSILNINIVESIYFFI